MNGNKIHNNTSIGWHHKPFMELGLSISTTNTDTHYIFVDMFVCLTAWPGAFTLYRLEVFLLCTT